MLNQHNLFRSMESLPLFILNDTLNNIALLHAKRMARLNWLNDYQLKEKLIKLIEYNIIEYSISLGSNPEIAIKQLINDPIHRLKILGNFEHFGVGNFKSKTGMKYWCMLYGKLK